MLKTKDYSMFKFRPDNRERIIKSHVKNLVESIRSLNLLELRPITVNQDMEVIDGQHRLLAAQELDVEIYYQVEKNLSGKEIILMNTCKSWVSGDYLNFYCKNGYQDYIKLKDFMKKNNLHIKVALNICVGSGRQSYTDYKAGKFVYKDDTLQSDIDICWETIELIKRMNGFSAYTESSRFWKALLKLVTHHDFYVDKWMSNAKKMAERFTAKASTKDYYIMMQEIYNWRNNEKISLMEDI